MRTKLLYATLVAGVLLLLGYAVSLTQTLFHLQVPPQAPAAVTPAIPAPVATAERYIELGPPPTPPDAKPDPAPAPIRKPTVTSPETTAPGGPASRIQAARAKPTADAALTPETPPGNPASATNRVGVVAALRGQAFARNVAQNPRPLAMDAPLFGSEQVSTGPGARLQVKFLDGSLLSLGENSEVVLEDYAFQPEQKSLSHCVMRVVKGVSRVVTGTIVDLNPNGFKVKTGLATIGIRGCDLGFRNTSERDEIMVFDLAGARHVQVDTTTDGSPLLDPLTGQTVAVDPAKARTLVMDEPRRMIAVQRGVGVEERPLSLDDILKFSDETWHYSQAQYDLLQGPQGAVIRVQPLPEPPANKPGEAKP